MSANQTFDTNDPRGALAMLDAILSSDNMNFNRAIHNGISRAVATLGHMIEASGSIEARNQELARALDDKHAEIARLNDIINGLTPPAPDPSLKPAGFEGEPTHAADRPLPGLASK